MKNAILDDIRRLILSARAAVARNIDVIQVHTNFEIGRRIVEEEQRGQDRAAYGQKIIQTLAMRLTGEFGKGFSLSNLKLMRQFFVQHQSRIGQTSSGQLKVPVIGQTTSGLLASGTSKAVPALSHVVFALSWSHYVFLLTIKNPDERRFYEIEAANERWTLRELKRQFDSSLYERLVLSRDKRGARKFARQGQRVSDVNDVLKEPLVLEFLGLNESSNYSESDLESAIINQLERFLLELGKGFLFQARQRRFTFDGDHFFVDLVFYNRDRHEKAEDENPTIGMILCKQRNKALVEITLPRNANIHAKEYQLYLPDKEDLRRKLDQWVGDAKGADI